MSHRDDYKNVICLGLGGSLVYRVALFFHYLGSKVNGFDQAENERVKDLMTKGVGFTPGNPLDKFDHQADLIVYSSALPKELIEKLKQSNRCTRVFEAGEFASKLVDDYEAGRLSEKEKQAFLASELAPLYNLALGNIPVIGVTGTDGKTTTCELIYYLLTNLGQKPAIVTTVTAKCGDVVMDTGFHTTTPTAQELVSLIQKFKMLGCTHIVVEISSHALAMGRVAGLKLDVAVITNVTHDHLDYHGIWDNYLNAKSLIVTNNLKSNGILVLPNADAKVFDYMREKTGKLQTILISAPDGVEEREAKTTFRYDGQPVALNLPGAYNAYNACNALHVCRALGFGDAVFATAPSLRDFRGVEGRMQVIQAKPFTAIIDFASTPNALENALQSARNFVGKGGKLIVVFGCAGNRDILKRPMMGSIAKTYAEITVLTAEDPRTEKVADINAEIKQGWDNIKQPNRTLTVFNMDEVANRRTAINYAVGLAGVGDVVIVCGKGHEKSMCFGTTEYAWSDIKELQQALKR